MRAALEASFRAALEATDPCALTRAHLPNDSPGARPRRRQGRRPDSESGRRRLPSSSTPFSGEVGDRRCTPPRTIRPRTALLTAAHRRASRALVTIRYQPHELELEIRGDGSIPDLDQSLRDIAQRVALYDGSLQTLPARGDGFAVQARLPVGAAIPA